MLLRARILENFPLPLPACCRASRKRNWEVRIGRPSAERNEEYSTRPSKHAVVLDAVKAEPSVAAEERPALTASARVGRDDTRSGRKKACGAVEQKKCRKPWMGAGLAGASMPA